MTVVVNGKRRGRRKLPASETRRNTISVRLTDMELADLRIEAAAVGRENEVGRFLYERHAGRMPLAIPAVNLEAWGRLGKVAGGLTTMAKAAAAGQLPFVDRALIEDVRIHLKEVRFSLIGGDSRPRGRSSGGRI